MMNRILPLFACLALAACSSSAPTVTGGATPTTPPTEGEVVTQDLSFTTSDGAVIYAQLRGVEPLVARPTIVEFSPYGIGSGVPEFGPAYNHVFVHARGTGNSTGTWTAVGPNDQRDVSEFMTWACTQPWSNGHNGLYGFSASAIAVYNSLHLPLPCVDAAALMAGTHDLYRDLLYPGGLLNMAPGAVVGVGVGAPILAAGLLRLQEGQLATSQVLSGLGFLTTVLNVIAHPSEDEFWLDRTQRAGPNRFPLLADTSFYDVESRGPFESYQDLRDQGVPVQLRTFGAHDGMPAGTPGAQAEYQRWFDHYLLGIANGIDTGAPVQLYVGNGSYEELIAGHLTKVDAQDYPIPGTRWQAMHLNAARGGGARSLNDGTLTAQPSATAATLPYAAVTSLPTATDPYTTAVVAGSGAKTVFEYFPFLTQLTLMEPLGLTWTTPALTRDILMVGPAALEVRIASVLPEADIHAVITDVWPDGSAHPISAGRLRSSYPNLIEEKSRRDAQGNMVQPYTDYSAKSYATPGVARDYHVEFWPIGNLFQTGHRLRLYLVGAPTYSVPTPGINLVSIGGDAPARLLLPLPPGNDLCAAIGASC